ncbi:MAG TPA: L-dopachrome tautomerase-related protein [Bryobacteraceae bacterium]|nr:L-dopachrome tautomerase-related protein [Bryobacteraceae bacterium]
MNAQTQNGKTLTPVYQNNDFQITGVTVSKSGRLFVNFPRWSDKYLNAVVEVMKDGSVKPYPDEAWNRWDKKPESAGRQFVCVQSVVADDQDSLWVVDPAAPMMATVVPGGPKVVQISLSKNQVTRVFPFGSDVVKPTSYLNDIRVDTKRNVAYVTDSGAGAIIVLDTKSGKAHRMLDGDQSTKPEPGVSITVDSKAVLAANGKPPQIGADSIALSNDGEYLYYKPLTGATVYRVKTSALRGNGGSSAAGAVEKVAAAFPTDGFWMDSKDTLYLSNINESAVYRMLKGGKPEKLLNDKRLVWPDTFSQGPHGSIYISASHISDSPQYNHGKSTRTMPYAVFKFRP